MFAQELIDEVISHLHDDPKALKRCALVSSSWVFPSRRFIFATIFLSPRSHLEELESLFRSTAHVAHFARTLVIEEADTMTGVDEGLDFADEDAEIKPSWLEDHLGLISLLTNVVNLELLSFNWKQLSSRAKNVFRTRFPLVKRLAVIEAKFWTFQALQEFIQLFPMIEDLHLEALEWWLINFSVGPIYSELEAGNRALKRIQLEDTGALGHLLRSLSSSPFNVSYLKTLRIHTDIRGPSETRSIGKMLKHLGQSLERLEIGFGSVMTMMFGGLFMPLSDAEREEWTSPLGNISLNTNLRCLHFLDLRLGKWLESFPWVDKLITSIAESSHLEHVLLRLTVRSQETTRGVNWARMDVVLMSLPRLKRVSLIVFIERAGHTREVAECHDTFRSLLPCLRKRGLLFISSSECGCVDI